MNALTDSVHAFNVQPHSRAHSPGVPNRRIRPAAANEAETEGTPLQPCVRSESHAHGHATIYGIEPLLIAPTRGRDLSPIEATHYHQHINDSLYL
jgi:hypothetical protein